MNMHRVPLAFALAFALCGPALAVPDTAYNLGVDAYRNKDYAVARKYWEEAVLQDSVEAHNNLGFLLYEGWGGMKDAARAVVLWRKAAEQGLSEAQWHLGDALAEGQGAERDPVAAYTWYRCAAAPRSDADELDELVAADARKALSRLLDKLDTGQLAAAELRARECIDRLP